MKTFFNEKSNQINLVLNKSLFFVIAEKQMEWHRRKTIDDWNNPL